jgi:hypothetical protein
MICLSIAILLLRFSFCLNDIMLADIKLMLCRRRFLEFVAASPLFAYTGLPGPLNSTRDAIAWAAEVTTMADITSVSQALNVFDLERVAIKNLPGRGWTGARYPAR